jgi:ADP-glucose pyrophosphorylase
MQLRLKAFSVDVMVSPCCDSGMQRIAVIKQPSVIAAMLDCLKRTEQPS